MTSMSRMSYLHKPHTSPMSHRLLFEHLDEQASMYPDKEALVYRDEHFRRKTITFKQYQQRSHALAARLLELGLRRGDAAISMLPGDIEYMVVNMALNRIGVNAVIIEPNADGTLPFLENIKNIKAVICCDQFPGVISAVQGFIHRKSIKVAIVVGIAPEGDQRLYSYEDLVQQGDDTSSALKQAQAEVQMDDHALVIFTSGSTGIPKPIQFTNHGFVNSSIFSAPKLKASSESIFFCDAPFDWITGLSVSTLVAIVGCTVVSFPPKVAFKSEMTGTLLRCVAEERATHAVFISYFMMSILEYDGLDTASLSALQYISTGGQPIDPTLLKRVFQALPALCEIQIVYAATEFNVLATCDVTRENIDSDEYGYLDCHEGTELKVVDSEGHLVPVGTPGE
ncbi:predicted protein [Nematostella vectensis]|uniref:AMP-dependent synthetase/ligase domain-containing protein n=2 Tax=Nematostella vectensis TaxID=45351 RepID=A7SVE7_NEMVE|nr:predicted protein [Nematostella vectensis]|eukprot:XP_001624419.1 predicted protein [Nematostella vectensis]